MNARAKPEALNPKGRANLATGWGHQIFMKTRLTPSENSLKEPYAAPGRAHKIEPMKQTTLLPTA